MAGRKARLRTRDDLTRAVRAVARHFETDTVYLIGSQAILASWPDAPSATRTSIEFDAYPGNARAWESKHAGLEASEEIEAMFGFGSQFHLTFGFYVDGVDENTATLPKDWMKRAVRVQVEDGDRTITAIAPALDDLIVSKLARLDDKDKSFIAACHDVRPLDLPHLERLLEKTELDPASRSQAIRFVKGLISKRSGRR